MAAKYKKRADGRYLTQIQIGINPDTGKPKYKNIYAHTIRELEEKASVYRHELEHGIALDENDLTVGAWAKKWLETYKTGVEYNTLEMYKNVVNVHIIPDIGQFKLKDLRPHHIQEMINKKASRGLTKTLYNIKSTLGQILEQAVANQYIYRNVSSHINLPNIEKSKKRSLTETEKRIILNADLDKKCKAFVYLLLYTGIRRGEALGLTKNDIDLEANKITVSKGLIFVGNKGEIKPSPKTDAGNRSIPMPAPLVSAMKEYLPTVESIYVFPSAKKTIMTETAFRRFWEKIIDKLNLAAGGTNGEVHVVAIAGDITPHLFRHTYATSLYYAGIDIKTAQYLLGHSSVEMTMDIYTHLKAENDCNVADKLNTFFSGQSKISQTNER